MGKFFTPEELESEGPFKAQTWRLWARQGRLPAIYLGRRVLVREEDRDAFYAAHVKHGPQEGASAAPRASKKKRREGRPVTSR